MMARNRRSYVLGFVLLALSAGTFLLHRAAHAQTAAPAAQQSGDVQSGKQDAGSPEREEKPDEKDEYRLSKELPVSPGNLARLLHTTPERAADIFDWANFLVLAFAIAWALNKVLPAFFRKRTHTISAQLTEARDATTDARHRLDVVEQRLSKLDDEILRMKGSAERDLLHEEERFRQSLDDERQRIVDTAEEEISAAGAAARRDLKAFAAELAVAQAERNLHMTPEIDSALVRDFAVNLGRNGSRN